MLAERPQLAILDGLMPLLSGFEVIDKVRAWLLPTTSPLCS